MKANLKHNLQYYWWAYLLLSTILVLLWSLIFSALKKIPNEDELYLFIGAELRDEEKLFNKIDEAVGALVKNIKFDTVNPESSFFSYQFLVRGTRAADIFILSEDKIIAEYCGPLFLELGDNLLARYFPDAEEFFSLNGKIYGLKVYDGKNCAGILADYVACSGEDYYLFFNCKSSNIGEIEHSPENLRDEALLAVGSLFGGAWQ